MVDWSETDMVVFDLYTDYIVYYYIIISFFYFYFS